MLVQLTVDGGAPAGSIPVALIRSFFVDQYAAGAHGGGGGGPTGPMTYALAGKVGPGLTGDEDRAVPGHLPG